MEKTVLSFGFKPERNNTLYSLLSKDGYVLRICDNLKDMDNQISAVSPLLVLADLSGMSMDDAIRVVSGFRRLTLIPLVTITDISAGIPTILWRGADVCLSSDIDDARLVSTVKAQIRRNTEYEKMDRLVKKA